jgi:hypothetical protein
MVDLLYKYIHKLNIDRNVLTDIRNKDKNKLLEDFDLFNKKYGKDSSINWKKVSEDYGGIEICPFLKKRREKNVWYWAWDVASGCIWNTKSIIKNTELIYEKKKHKYIKVKSS